MSPVAVVTDPDQLTLTQWLVPNATYYGGPSTQYLTFTTNCIPVRGKQNLKEEETMPPGSMETERGRVIGKI